MANIFFPILLFTDLNNLTTLEYCKKKQILPITKKKVIIFIIKPAKDKTAGLDKIPAEILQTGFFVLLNHLL